MLVGLIGYAGSGKDTAAAGLIAKGWTRIALADPLKDIAARIGWNGKKDRAGRELLQNLGAAVRDVFGDDAWIDVVDRRVDSAPGDVVVTDIRYPNEAEWVHRRGGILVRIDRPGVGPANGHASERADLLLEDFVVKNDCSPELLMDRLQFLVAS